MVVVSFCPQHKYPGFSLSLWRMLQQNFQYFKVRFDLQIGTELWTYIHSLTYIRHSYICLNQWAAVMSLLRKLLIRRFAGGITVPSSRKYGKLQKLWIGFGDRTVYPTRDTRAASTRTVIIISRFKVASINNPFF